MVKSKNLSLIDSLKDYKQCINLCGGWHILLYFLFYTILGLIAFIGPILWYVIRSYNLNKSILSFNLLWLFIVVWFLMSFVSSLYQATITYLYLFRKKINYLFFIIKNIRTLIIWSLMSGLILGSLAWLFNRLYFVKKLNLISKSFASALVFFSGVSWITINTFTIPILLTENIGIIDAIKKSAKIIKINLRQLLEEGNMRAKVLGFSLIILIAISLLFGFLLGPITELFYLIVLLSPFWSIILVGTIVGGIAMIMNMRIYLECIKRMKH